MADERKCLRLLNVTQQRAAFFRQLWISSQLFWLFIQFLGALRMRAASPLIDDISEN